MAAFSLISDYATAHPCFCMSWIAGVAQDASSFFRNLEMPVQIIKSYRRLPITFMWVVSKKEPTRPSYL
jgi:hypothetical protein